MVGTVIASHGLGWGFRQRILDRRIKHLGVVTGKQEGSFGQRASYLMIRKGHLGCDMEQHDRYVTFRNSNFLDLNYSTFLRNSNASGYLFLGIMLCEISSVKEKGEIP